MPLSPVIARVLRYLDESGAVLDGYLTTAEMIAGGFTTNEINEFWHWLAEHQANIHYIYGSEADRIQRELDKAVGAALGYSTYDAMKLDQRIKDIGNLTVDVINVTTSKTQTAIASVEEHVTKSITGEIWDAIKSIPDPNKLILEELSHLFGKAESWNPLGEVIKLAVKWAIREAFDFADDVIEQNLYNMAHIQKRVAERLLNEAKT